MALEVVPWTEEFKFSSNIISGLFYETRRVLQPLEMDPILIMD